MLDIENGLQRYSIIQVRHKISNLRINLYIDRMSLSDDILNLFATSSPHKYSQLVKQMQLGDSNINMNKGTSRSNNKNRYDRIVFGVCNYQKLLQHQPLAIHFPPLLAQ